MVGAVSLALEHKGRIHYSNRPPSYSVYNYMTLYSQDFSSLDFLLYRAGSRNYFGAIHTLTELVVGGKQPNAYYGERSASKRREREVDVDF